MTVPSQPPEQPHRNHGLFSDHYLRYPDGKLPQRPEWRAMAEEARQAMEEIARIFKDYVPAGKEATVEHEVVRQVLDLLGHEQTYDIQPSLETREGTKEPDYVFYRNRAALEANRGRKLSDEMLRQSAFAVGEAEPWGQPLDWSKSSRSDRFTNRNPSFQIYFYIEQSGLEWGILTNGRCWRLYHKDTAHKLDRYYEVDLHELATSGDVGRFLYFYAFFRRPAFEEQPLGVAQILRESTEYAQGVGDTLKSQVYEALRHLAQGFLDHPQNRLTTDPGTLKDIYDNSLIVLYRLLFILYAEARDLLPVHESDIYRDEYSLYAIIHRVAGGACSCLRAVSFGKTLGNSSASSIGVARR